MKRNDGKCCYELYEWKALAYGLRYCLQQAWSRQVEKAGLIKSKAAVQIIRRSTITQMNKEDGRDRDCREDSVSVCLPEWLRCGK